MFKETNIEGALIPFAAVASDLYTGKTIVFKNGNTITGLIASNAAPLIMEPLKFKDYLLIDGVATAPLPVNVLFEEKIDIKIAVNIPQLDLPVSINDRPKLTTIYIRSRSMMANEIANYTAETADVIIKPQVTKSNLMDWSNIDKYIESGKEAALPAIKQIKKILKSPWHNE